MSESGRSGPMRWLPLLLVAGMVFLMVTSRGSPSLNLLSSSAPYHHEAEGIMGTKLHLVIVPGPEMKVTPEEAADHAVQALRKAEAAMSRFREDSDVSRLNSARAGEWVRVGPETWRVVMEALRFNRLSDSAFDSTVGPLYSIYSYSNKSVKSLPGADQIREVLARVGSDKIKFDREGWRLAFTVDGMVLDLGAVAKGYGVDKGMEALQKVGVRNAMLEVGGEVRMMGKVPDVGTSRQEIGETGNGEPPTRDWRTGVQHPRLQMKLLTILEKSNCAIATSGDYERFFEIDGKRYSHILDPRTGRPVQGGVVGATVIHPSSCMKADALATTVSVLGEKEGRSWLEKVRHDLGLIGVEVILGVLEDNGSIRTVHFRITDKGIEDIQE